MKGSEPGSEDRDPSIPEPSPTTDRPKSGVPSDPRSAPDATEGRSASRPPKGLEGTPGLTQDTEPPKPETVRPADSPTDPERDSREELPGRAFPEGAPAEAAVLSDPDGPEEAAGAASDEAPDPLLHTRGAEEERGSSSGPAIPGPGAVEHDRSDKPESAGKSPAAERAEPPDVPGSDQANDPEASDRQLLDVSGEEEE